MTDFDPYARLQTLLGAPPTVAAAPPLPLFAANSRYQGIQVATFTLPDGTDVVYLRRRLVPQPDTFAIQRTVKFTENDRRLDYLTFRQLGDSELFWRLCDANRVLRPEELEVLNRAIRIPYPAGIPAPTPVDQ